MIRKFSLAPNIVEGLKFLEDCYKKPPSPVETKEYLQITSERSLKNLLKNPPLDVCEVSRIDHISVTNKNQSSLSALLSSIYPKCSILMSGHFFYPKNGYMSWHTNNKAPGLRVYFSYTEHANSSFFTYKDGDKIVKDPDWEGWTGREFRISKEGPPLWHAIYAEKPRISIGFRVINNLL